MRPATLTLLRTVCSSNCGIAPATHTLASRTATTLLPQPPLQPAAPRHFAQLSNSQAKLLAKQERARDQFNDYYRAVYGDRWDASLLPALLSPTRYVAALNRYIGSRNLAVVRDVLSRLGAQPFVWPEEVPPHARIECWMFPCDATTVASPLTDSSSAAPHFPSAVDTDEPSDARFPPPQQLLPLLDPSTALCAQPHAPCPLPYYPMDLGSVLAAVALAPHSHDSVFDLCAAPGGKSLLLAQMLQLEAHDGAIVGESDSMPLLHVNDVSAARRQRLQRVLRSYLPARLCDDPPLHVHGMDLLQRPLPAAAYDSVLLDAPCSSDRHTLHAPAVELPEWSPARFRRDATRQRDLLLQALRTVKVGSSVAYSTCSLSPTENDDVIDAVRAQCDKWIRKGKSGRDGMQVDFEVEPIAACAATSSSPSAAKGGKRAAASRSAGTCLPIGEPTRHGWIILPDQLDFAAANNNATQPATNEQQTDSRADAAKQSPSLAGHGFGPLFIARLRRVAPK